MTFTAWLSVATICGLGAITPGPSLAVILRHSLHHSRQAGLACAVAHGAGIGFYALITMAGLGIVFQTVPAVRNTVSVLGALYLLYMAWKAWVAAGSAGRFDTAAGGQVVHRSIWHAARDGFLIAFLNPKVALFFLALFSQFVSPDFSWGAKLLLALTAAGIDTLWYCLVAVGLSHGTVLPWLQRNAAVIERTIAVVFVLVAGRVLMGVLVAG